MGVFLRIGLENAVAALILALLVALLGLFVRRPALLHALWVVVLLKLVTPPVVRLPLVLPGLPYERGPSSGATGLAREPGSPGPFPAGQTPVVASGTEPAPPGRHSVAETPRGVSSTSHEPAPASGAGAPVIAGLGWLWLSGSVVWLSLATVRTLRFRRVLRGARPAPEEVLARVRELAARMGLRRSPGVSLTRGIVSPVVWGLGPPRILLPENLWNTLGREEADTLLVHEIAHLRRRDHWVRLLEVAATCLYWWHPVAWWAKREIVRAEEDCCDAWVLWTLPGSSGPYGRALLATVDFVSAGGGVPVPALGSRMGGARSLRRRMERILRGGRPRALTNLGRALVLLTASSVLPFLPVLSPAGMVPAAGPAEPLEGQEEDAGGKGGGKKEPGPDPAPDFRRRLEAVEAKLDRILKELEAVRAAQGGGAPEGTGELQYKGKPLGQWILDLGDRDRQVQENAIGALYMIGPEAFPRLLTALKSGDWLLRENAVEAIWRMEVDTRIKVETLLSMLLDPEKRVGDAAARSLWSLPPTNPDPIPVLIGALQAEAPRVRMVAASALGSLASRADAPESTREALRQAVPALIAALGDRDEDVRRVAAANLGKFGPLAAPAIPALAESLKDPNMRKTAAVSAAAIGPGERTGDFLPVLIELVKPGGEPGEKPDWGRSWQAAEALGKLGPAAREAVPALGKLLRELLEHPPPAQETKPDGTEPEYRYTVAGALARIAGERLEGADVPLSRVLEVLIEAVSSNNPSTRFDTRIEAMRALAALGPAARAAIPSLEAVESSPRASRPPVVRTRAQRPKRPPDDEERTAAEEALKKIRGG